MLKATLPVAEILIIKRDVDLMMKLFNLPAEIRSLFGINFLPYAALVCYEAINYMDKKGQHVEVEQTSKYSIREIRNKAKFFDLRFNQIMQSAFNIDALQHNDFAQQMRYPELANWNIHDNLGIFFDNDKNIIGNTQYSVWVFQDESTIKKPLSDMDGFEVQNKEAYTLGFDLGRIANSISKGLSSVKDFLLSDVNLKNMTIYANDFNTNRCWVDGIKKYKVIRLLLLHILSSIGFILNIVKKCIVRDSGLLLRLEYIIYHSTLKRLRQLNQYVLTHKHEITDEKIHIFLSAINFDADSLRNTSFGNCMRHYGLTDEDTNALIHTEQINLALPLCGLVESHFNKSYSEYKSEIEKELFVVYDHLNDYMGFNDLLSIDDDMLAR